MRYEPVIAHRYLCVCALLEMVIRSVNARGPNQIEIAEFLGVHFPRGHSQEGISNVHHTDDPSRWGVVVQNHEINNLFHSYSIPLTEEYIPINNFEDWSFEDKIKDVLRSGAHVLCGYSARSLDSSTRHDDPVPWGHAVAVLDAEPCSGAEHDITVYDPGPQGSGERRIRGWRLFAAIKARMDGLWIIK